VARRSPFDDHPEFFEQDNRKHRQCNPVTKGTLEAKLGVLLPAWLVKGKSVLDLGSCVGAAGQWSLFHGAASYTGVELQEDYVAKSQAFLSGWGTRAATVKSDIRSFLEQAAPRSYDIVVAAGVLYLFIDPETIVEQICRVASEIVMIESNYPRVFRSRTLAIKNALIKEYFYSQEVNMADGNYSLNGLAAACSPEVFDLFFKLHGFVNKEGRLRFPLSPDAVMYTDEALAEGMPARFAAQYFRARDPQALRTLEQNLPSRLGERRSWSSDPVHVLGGQKYTETMHALADRYKKWEFDAEAAATYEQTAEQSIPHYREVIDQTIEIIAKKGFDKPKIIDVGSAVGTTLKRLHEAGYRDIYGVDSSAHMLAKSFDQATLIQSDRFPTSHGPFDVVIANWVLHFIDDRERYLTDIRGSLRPNGVLILSENVQHGGLVRSLYRDFQRSKGLSDAEIEERERRLAGVLQPYPLRWYLGILEELRFTSVEVVDARYGFVTLLAQC
jgi:tRNA (cmo5U34)-methyltransferase